MIAPIAHVPAVDETHRALALTYKQIASILRVDEGRLKRWRSGKSVPSRAFLNRLENLDEFLAEVRATFGTSNAPRRWIRARAPEFNDHRPLDLLLDGRIERVTAALRALNVGMTT